MQVAIKTMENTLKSGIMENLRNQDLTETSYRLVAIQAQLNNIGREIRKTEDYLTSSRILSFHLRAIRNQELRLKLWRFKWEMELGASVSVMPLSNYLNLGLGELAHTKLMVELADRIVKYLKGIAENVLVGIELRRDQVDDLMPTIEESKSSTILKDKFEYKGKNVVGAFMNIPIFVGKFSVVTYFPVVENMDGYRDQDMGDVIVGEPFCKASCVEARRFDGLITIHNGNDNVTYQMARSYPRFRHLSNAQCKKIKPLLKVSWHDKLDGISHSYQKLKRFYKGILNLGPKYIRDTKMEEWLTRGHISVHEMK
ncbi:hypothetical protein Tco_0870604 [Tanacetum coccineum]